MDPEIAAHYALAKASTSIPTAGFALEALVAVEGVGHFVADPDAWLDDPARREALLRAIRRVESEPALRGASSHLLAVGCTPPSAAD